jgi:hypothetical protein
LRPPPRARPAPADGLWSCSPLPSCLRSFPALCSRHWLHRHGQLQHHDAVIVGRRHSLRRYVSPLLAQPQWQRLISRATYFLALTTWQRPLCSALLSSNKRFSRWPGQPCPIFTCPSSLVCALGCAGGAGTSSFEGGATPVADCSYGTCAAGKMVMIPIM